MGDFYTKFIKPKEITKDINFFYDKVIDIIKNQFFGEFIYDIRRKIKTDEYVINNYLSQFNNAKLRFKDDNIIVKFIVDKNKHELKDKSETTISKYTYKNHSITDLTINITIVISANELKNKIIYDNNQALLDLRKQIHKINEFYINKYRKNEERCFETIHHKLLNLKPSIYYDYNRLIKLLQYCTDPKYHLYLKSLGDISRQIDAGTMDVLFLILHKTQLYERYRNTNQIKIEKFWKSIKKQCLDDDEIIHLINNIAKCLGYKIKDSKESIEFINNVILHFNTICHYKLHKIDDYVQKCYLGL